MNSFIHNRQEQILVFLTAVFVIGVVAYYMWGVHTIANAIQNSIDIVPSKADVVHFNIEDAQKINFREQSSR